MTTVYRSTTQAEAHDETSDGASRVVLAPELGPEAQEPLGPEPTYDDALDVAVEYSFPCSDPIAIQSSGHTAAATRDMDPGNSPQQG